MYWLYGPFCFLCMYDALPTVDLNGLEIFAAGTFNGDSYSEADLDSMVSAFDQVGFKPTVKAGHADGQEDEAKARKVFGAPALGYVSRIYRQGKKLLADATKVPRRFADLVKAGSYSRISSEIYWNFASDDNGTKHPRVLKSIAFLGADIPALTSLKEIEALYQRNAEGSLFAYDENKQEYRLVEYCCGETTMPAVNGFSLADWLIRNPRKTKDDAGYTEAAGGQENCGNCKFYIGHMMACSLVEGYIEANYTSDYFEPRPGLQLFAKKDAVHSYVIQERDGKWCLMTHDGSKVLGCHDTEEAAQAQERAVQAAKNSSSDKTSKEYAMKIVEKGGKFVVMDGDEEVKTFPSREDAEAYMADDKEDEEDFSRNKGEERMTDKDYELKEQKLKDDFAAKEVALKKEFASQLATAKADAARAAADEKKQLEGRLNKLESERRAVSINSWLKDQKSAGKLAPVQEDALRAIMFALPDEGEKIVVYSRDGAEVKQSVAEAIKEFVSSQPSIFKTFSQSGDDSLPGDPLPNAGAEVDRQAKLYQEKHQEKDYAIAVRSVLRADKELARRWHETNN